MWVAWDYLTGRKPGLISGVNGMITGLVAITPAAGYVNGWGAIAMGVIASTLAAADHGGTWHDCPPVRTVDNW